MTTNDPKCNDCGREMGCCVGRDSRGEMQALYYCVHDDCAGRVLAEQSAAQVPDNASRLSYAQLRELFDLHQEHGRLLREHRRQVDADRDHRTRVKGAVIEIHYAHGASQRVGAEPVEASQFMASTIERRLDGIEQKMAALGVTDIKRELPGRGSEHYEDLDDEIPF